MIERDLFVFRREIECPGIMSIMYLSESGSRLLQFEVLDMQKKKKILNVMIERMENNPSLLLANHIAKTLLSLDNLPTDIKLHITHIMKNKIFTTPRAASMIVPFGTLLMHGLLKEYEQEELLKKLYIKMHKDFVTLEAFNEEIMYAHLSPKIIELLKKGAKPATAFIFKDLS